MPGDETTINTPAAAESTTAPMAPASADTVTAEPAIELEGKKWSKGALIVAAGNIPTGEKRPVIVVETRGEDGKLVEDRKYPTKGDLYYRTDPAVDFGNPGGPIITLGVDVRQGMLWGFSPDAMFVNVGPASPIYAAANIAWQNGAEDIEIVGLTDAQKAQLSPWFAKLAEGGPAPGAVEDPQHAPVDVRLPANCKITLR